MEMNHTPRQMAAALRAAVNTLRTPEAGKMTDAEAMAAIDGYLTAAPLPPPAVTMQDRLVAGIVKALR